ncbi:MAG TPA: hypothetical protein VGP12_03185, partial [Nitrosospira sp.]|nr:hypothetical protein [Nitrosospira sp.]
RYFDGLQTSVRQFVATQAAGFPIHDLVLLSYSLSLVLSTFPVDKFVDKLWTRSLSHTPVTVFSRLAVF